VDYCSVFLNVSKVVITLLEGMNFDLYPIFILIQNFLTKNLIEHYWGIFACSAIERKELHLP
jgi:hypothetical protein